MLRRHWEAVGINEATEAVGFDEIYKSLVVVWNDAADFLEALTIGCIQALLIFHQGEWTAAFAVIVNIDHRSIQGSMLDSLWPNDGRFKH